jgi:hypothetical protein
MGLAANSYTQRRTLTPFTMTHLQAATGRRATTAPLGPAQPARTTPAAQTTAFASVGSTVTIAAIEVRVRAASTSKRILASLVRVQLFDRQIGDTRGQVWVGRRKIQCHCSS